MSITIEDHELPFDTHNEYTVHVGPTHSIHTLLTFCPLKLGEWISRVSSPPSPSPLLVGLDIEWRPNRQRNQDNPAATLQLCVSGHCVVFQLLYCDPLPKCLFDFLGSQGSTFCGVGIQNDVEKLLEDYGLGVGGRVVDLGGLAAERRGARDLRKAGLKELARVVLGLEVQKPKSVSCSRWDQEWLYPDQVKYACADAFLSFEIGRVLNATAAAAAEEAVLGGASESTI